MDCIITVVYGVCYTCECFLNSIAMQLQDVFKLINYSVDPVSDTGRTRKTTGLCGFADIEDALRRTQFPGRGRWR